MHKIAAELRHRELTQEIYNIGDEVVDYIEHLIEAIEDWDEELALDCLAELGDIVEDARVDSGRCVGELIGLRHALVSGLKSGTISAASSGDNDVEEPAQLTARALAEGLPISGPPVVVSELAETLRGRTAAVAAYLRELVEYVLAQTDAVARNLDVISLPNLYKRAGESSLIAMQAWRHTVVEAHPAFVRTMRGHNPPPFLEERARIDAVVARVRAKRQKKAATTA
ncbi:MULTISPECIES: hypothetical protein [Corynebacterium]|uniref:Uncharacterized protein n=1 Tax=Corynebacterium singulare TaxID=161899 RepID=A0A0B6EXJ0_9CORY|nr:MULTISPECIES: hypothetical protein [Corynebacterium]AJI79523.1 hypothetical protein CSING_10055 [Corynebacterium singulare]MCG7275702.1 hypothetical protein [Corynebacterium singulare]OFT57402.1 hypothetical protein HMPREF3149_12615 [Corynebacterium sp. HMSC05E07]